jgi:two-component system, LytTR family, response regulator
MSRPTRVLIVDDEKPARGRLQALLDRQPGVQVTAAWGGQAALEAVTAAADAGAPVDVVFLDVQMPEMDGFAMLEALYALPLDPMPVVVFATAYDEYALRAFDAHAVDYLLKPYSDERFEVALTRAIRLARSERSDALVARMHALLDDVGRAPPTPAGRPAEPPRHDYLDRLALRERGRVRLVDVGDIRWIEADGVYVTIHTAGGRYLHREVLGHLEARLDPRRFVRIHRSHIVNFDVVRELVQDAHGEYTVRLADATALKVGRLYRSRLEERLDQRL